MKLFSFVGAAALATLLAACAAEPVAPATSNASNASAPATSSAAGADDLVCTREYPIGSNIPVNKCRTRAQIEADRAASQENLKRTQTGGPSGKMGGG